MAFASCKSLAEIVLPEGITDIGAEFLSDTPAGEFFFDDKDVMIINGTVVDVRNTIMLEIPEGAVRIAPWLLSETWTDIRAIAFPEGLEYIGDGAFSGFFPEQIFLPVITDEARCYDILLNPFPIFPQHLVIALSEHRDQGVLDRLPDLLFLTRF